MFLHPRKFVPISLAFTAISVASCDSGADNAIETPNIVFIHIDDLGWSDLGFMGSEFYETPNIDKLATEGLVFTHAYAGAANCAPSRANLFTGKNSPRHGMYTVNPADRGNPRTRQLIASPNADSIPSDIYNLANLFKDVDYTTAHIGKWHLSENPLTHGFDYNIGGDNRGHPGQGGYFAPYNIANIEQGPDGEYLTDRLTDEAVTFIKNNKDQPFFLHMSFYTVHTPLMGKEEMVEKYRMKNPTDNHFHPVYAAMIESMDENVGRILNTIIELGLEENTFIVFISDNGGIRAISRQDPLRAGKGSYYEGGIRVPMILKWPGKIQAASSDEPVTNLDFFPTFKNILGVELEDKILDGDDLSPLFTGGSIGKRPLIWHFPIYLQQYNGKVDQGRDPLFRTRPGSIIRYGNWKLHEYFEDGALELYNLDTDPGEKQSLADIHPEKTKELHQMLIQWRKELNAPVPAQRNQKYDPAFEQRRIEQVLSDNNNMYTDDPLEFLRLLVFMSKKSKVKF